MKTVVQQFLSYVYRSGGLQKYLTIGTQKVSVPKEGLVNRDFEKEEVEQLLTHFQKNNAMMYALLYTLVSTGMRIQELASAK